MTDKLVEFLNEHRDHFRLSQLDKEMGATPGTTSRILRGVQYRYFTDEQSQKLTKYLKRLCKTLQEVA
jgi:hypothetical protein